MRSTARCPASCSSISTRAIEDLLLDRIVWFLRNVDVSKGLADVVEHYRAGIEAVAGALTDVLPPERRSRSRRARRA